MFETFVPAASKQCGIIPTNVMETYRHPNGNEVMISSNNGVPEFFVINDEEAGHYFYGSENGLSSEVYETLGRVFPDNSETTFEDAKEKAIAVLSGNDYDKRIVMVLDLNPDEEKHLTEIANEHFEGDLNRAVEYLLTIAIDAAKNTIDAE